MRAKHILVLLIAGHCLLIASATAQVPSLINYQGRLISGTNLYNGAAAVTFRIYTVAAGGAHVFESTNQVTVVDGLYSTAIGQNVTWGGLDAALDRPEAWLEVGINGASLSPRERIVAVGYARVAHRLGALRVEPDGASSPNLIGGASVNAVSPGVVGATIGGGGSTNYAAFGHYSENFIQSDFSVISGGNVNRLGTNSACAVIGGGLMNEIEADGAGAAIGGGEHNWTRAALSTIGGGHENGIDEKANHATIGGGYQNGIDVEGTNGTVSGGRNNAIVQDPHFRTTHTGTIGGGAENKIRAGGYATIGGGYQNVTGNSGPLVADGGFATVGGGNQNCAEGDFATSPGGDRNWAKGSRSFAAGTRAKAMGEGAFVWADSQSEDFAPTLSAEVSFRCWNGVIFTKDSSYSKYVSWTPAAGSWSFGSDRNSKDHIEPVDGGDVLDKVARLPISEWNYIGYAQRHIGPMAQDFHALFPLNEDDKTLNEADLHGVALAAIRELARQNKEQQIRFEEQQKRIEALETRIGQLQAK